MAGPEQLPRKAAAGAGAGAGTGADDPAEPADDEKPADKTARKAAAATGTTAASTRAFLQQLIAFYFRAPVKAFFRTRFDYTAYVRAVLDAKLPDRLASSAAAAAAATAPGCSSDTALSSTPRPAAPETARPPTRYPSHPVLTAWLDRLRTTTPVLLTQAVRRHGWSFLPNQVLPPLLANVFVGAVLYTSYLQSLSLLHAHQVSADFPAGLPPDTPAPPPSGRTVFTAGLIAGSVQSLGAAPLDALQLRFQVAEMYGGGASEPNMWLYARDKLRSIGAVGIFAGFGISLLKDGLGYGLFFAAFEVTKTQAFDRAVAALAAWHSLSWRPRWLGGRPPPPEPHRPHYLLEPAFLLLAGATATLSQQLVVHPLSRIQEVHLRHLEAIDNQAALLRAGSGSTITTSRPHLRAGGPSPSPILRALASAAEIATRPLDGRLHVLRLYWHAYADTLSECGRLARRLARQRAREAAAAAAAAAATGSPPQPDPLDRLLSTIRNSRTAAFARRHAPERVRAGAQALAERARHALALGSALGKQPSAPQQRRSAVRAGYARAHAAVMEAAAAAREATATFRAGAATLGRVVGKVPVARRAMERADRAAQAGRVWRLWMYRHFWAATVRQVPSTSAGLIIFEVFRRRHADAWDGREDVY